MALYKVRATECKVAMARRSRTTLLHLIVGEPILCSDERDDDLTSLMIAGE
jgi:hypothetical protein